MAVMDQVIWGRDIDGSGEKPQEELMRAINKGAAGVFSGNPTRFWRKPGLSQYTTMDKIIYSREFDHKATTTPEEHMKMVLSGAAGVKAFAKKDRERQPGLIMSSMVDHVVFNGAMQEPEDDFILHFEEYA